MIDFLVIGGGIAGISAAARLSELGHVEVLEAEEALGTQASGRSAAMFEETYGAWAVQALNRASSRFLEKADVLSPRGFLLIDGEDADAFQRDLDAMAMEEISVSDAQAMVPILNNKTVSRAAYDDGAMDIDTDRLIQQCARILRRSGGTVHLNTRVSGIALDADTWRVAHSQGETVARHLVNAAGAWADQVAKLAGVAPIGLTPYRRSMARIAAPGGHDVTRWPMLFGAGEAWYAKPDAGALLVSPADEDATHPHDAWADDMILAEGLARYEAHVTEPVTRPIANWAGLRSFAPDRMLILGPDPEVPRFLWCAGQGGYGFQSSPAASQLLADLAAGRPSELDAEVVAALSPARFRR